MEAAFETKLSELLPSEGSDVVNVDPPESRSAGGHEIGKIEERTADQVGHR